MDNMGLEVEMSESSSSSIAEDKATLPDGMFIVQNIVDHKCYGELQRRKLIDRRRNVSHKSLFFRVEWKGFPDQDTWEPLQSIQHVNVFKDYARKHSLKHFIPSSSDSSETESSYIDGESMEGEEKEEKEDEEGYSGSYNEKCPRKKSRILIDSETDEENDKMMINSRGNKRKHQQNDDYDAVMKYSQKIDCKKKTWWFRSSQKKKFGYRKLFIHQKSHDDISGSSNSNQNGQKKERIDNNEISHKSMRKYIEMTSDGFTATTNRTRSVSPIIDKVLRKQQFHDHMIMDDGNFCDDQNFLKRTKISVAIAQSELAFVAKKLEEGCILRIFWMKICNYNLQSPLRQIRKAKACELESVLFRIIKESKNFEKYYLLLRKCLIEQNAFEFLKQLQIIKRWCIKTCEDFNDIIFAFLTANENISKLIQMLSSKCFSPEHHRCGILKISLSYLSMQYRGKIFERLIYETKYRLLDIIIGMSSSGGGFCLLDTLIKYGINIGGAKIHAIQQCILNGNEEVALHLILNGFEVKYIKELPDSNLHEQACKIVDSINIYLDRLNLKIQYWTMTLLKENSTKFILDTDTFPISNICLHRPGQIDRNICLNVSSSKSLSTTTFSSKKSSHMVLVMHSFTLSSAESIMDIGIHQSNFPVQFHKHLRFHFGNPNDEMDMICVLHNNSSCIYWFANEDDNKIDTRVHVKLTHTPSDYINETNDLVVLQLWDMQISPALLLALIKKTELKQ